MRVPVVDNGENISLDYFILPERFKRIKAFRLWRNNESILDEVE
jgi:hypothetical protein